MHRVRHLVLTFSNATIFFLQLLWFSNPASSADLGHSHVWFCEGAGLPRPLSSADIAPLTGSPPTHHQLIIRYSQICGLQWLLQNKMCLKGLKRFYCTYSRRG